MTSITPHAIAKFLADSRRYLAHENPRFNKPARSLPPAGTRVGNALKVSRGGTPAHGRSTTLPASGAP